MLRPSALLSLALVPALALVGCRHEEHTEIQAADPPPPLMGIANVYDAAGERSLPPQAAHEYPGLANVFALSGDIVSGGEPLEEASFDHLKKWGIRTIVSVDGKAPDVEAAEVRGMRYVHVPIRYSGMTDEQVLQIAKTFRELEPPFYVHCFHGVHRGPAAAALGRVVRDGATREQAMAEMRQWCRTAPKYEGLYTTIASGDLPSREATAAFEFDFPSRKASPSDLRNTMIDLTRVHDDLKVLARNAWMAPATHPDLAAHRSAEQLASFFVTANELPAVVNGPADQKAWMAESVTASRTLADALRVLHEGPTQDGVALEGVALENEVRALTGVADQAFEDLRQGCASCHVPYRNR
jgi:protein tyrosine phosphatase (PTP) superfamily phosphohydrolase (DUF442 family)